MRGESGLTASDVALLSGRNGNNDGFGDNGSWWVIIFLIFAFMGWGRGNNGFGGGSNGYGAMDNYVLASDFATIQRQLSDGFGDLTSQTRYIQNGLCDGFYAMNTSLLNGFAGVNNAIMTNGYETRNAINFDDIDNERQEQVILFLIKSLNETEEQINFSPKTTTKTFN